MAIKKSAASRRKSAGKRNRQNRFSMFLAVTVVVILMAAISVISVRLTAELERKEKIKTDLEAQIAVEQERAKELEEYEKYVETDQYKEKVAREKLGMVKDGEIVFENQDTR
ncbi:MAG: septum formation initiator family protein [Lachnospiraceae bacterium]|nr:septum formation initiator family protein [Lachnospiraceae bacterium]